MRRFKKAPSLPGGDCPRNLVSQAEGFDACPCCGAMWKGGRPWTDKVLSPVELAMQMGQTPQSITSRIRMGTIAAYPGAGSGRKNVYLIPVFEAERVKEQDPLEGGMRPDKVGIQDLGVPRG